MAVYNPRLTTIDKNETRRYAGLKGDAEFPDNLVTTACADAQLLAQPRAVWRFYPYTSATGIIAAPDPLILTGKVITRHLANACEVAVLAVSVGQELEEEVTRRFAAGEYSSGLLLDAAGTAAVEAAADAANALIAAEAGRRGLQSRTRFSPGYADWPITDQAAVVDLAGGAAISLAVTATCMLVPRKSVTAVIGLAPAQSTATDNVGHNCAGCTQADCMARKE